MDTTSTTPPVADLLDTKLIIETLGDSTRQQLHDIHHYQVIDSTNVAAMQGIEQGRRHGHVYLAEQQTAGRGRRGREWISPFASNIYMSMVWQFNGRSDISALSLAVGVAVCRALQSLNIAGVGLKWPNDILANGKKLGGVLLEMQGDPSRECQVVIGIGLNVLMADNHAALITQPWVDVETLCDGARPSRNQLVVAMLEALVAVLGEYKQGGFAALKDAWQALDVYAGAEVMVQLGDDYIFGKASGVDDSGALRLQTATGIQFFHGGEVSLRPKGAL